jgi:alpha-galactosidase
VNHFIWFLKLRHQGRDLYPRLWKTLIDEGKGQDRPVSTELFRIYGCYPSPGDRHLVEFLPYYLKDEATRKKYNLPIRDNRANDQRRHEGRKACREVVSGKRPLPELKASGERAMHIISSVVNNKNEVHYANIPNRGYIRNLPDDVIVEVPTRFGRRGAVGEKVGDLPLGIHSHVVRIVSEQELGVEAAVTGDCRLALQAFLSDPIVADVAVAEKMLKEMFRKSRKWLPQFKNSG